jgi:hypothetical protein
MEWHLSVHGGNDEFGHAGRAMLLWRMKSQTAAGEGPVECHLVRRDVEYRLSLRRGKEVVVQETHRTMIAASERAEDLRRQAMQGAFPVVP